MQTTTLATEHFFMSVDYSLQEILKLDSLYMAGKQVINSNNMLSLTNCEVNTAKHFTAVLTSDQINSW